MTVYRFPAEMGASANTKRLPFVHFDIIKFRNRTFVTDNSNGSSSIAGSTSDEKVRLDSVYLPLPNDVQNNYSLNWEMADLRGIKALVDLFQADGIGGRIDSLERNLPGILFDKLAKVATARTPNPKKQALFNGIDPRTFTFTYLFSPQSLREAEQIEKIIKTLTIHALPSLENENAAFFQFPSEFDIKFHNVAGFPKPSTCVCTSISTNFSPNTMQLLESGHAVQTQLTMTFLETELLRKQKPGMQ